MLTHGGRVVHPNFASAVAALVSEASAGPAVVAEPAPAKTARPRKKAVAESAAKGEEL
jgi:NAD(P) transhydrogenase subunit alpha